MPKVTVWFFQKIEYKQEVDMSQEDFDVLSELDDDIDDCSPERGIIDKYIDFNEVLDAGDLEDVTVELVRPKKKL
jgi:hypothetical protein